MIDTSRNFMVTTKKFYSQFSYPGYPLLSTPRYQEHSHASSTFSQALCQRRQQVERVLIAGCGDSSPLVQRFWEHPNVAIDCVDLSPKNIRRAKWRCKLRGLRKMHFIASELSEFSKNTSHLYQHMDLFGVLHHNANPKKILLDLYSRLDSGGSMRIMIYNSYARRWIHGIQDALAALEINPIIPQHQTILSNIILKLRASKTALGHKLRKMPSASFHRFSILADTFCHPVELRWSPKQWFDLIEKTGLQILGILDPRAELDHLCNPMCSPPSGSTLDSLANQGLFNSNLLFYVQKPKNAEAPYHLADSPKLKTCNWLHQQLPPIWWFQFKETCGLNYFQKRYLYQNYLNKFQLEVRDMAKVPSESVLRFARLGLFGYQSEDSWINAPLASKTVKSKKPVSWPQLPKEEVSGLVSTIQKEKAEHFIGLMQRAEYVAAME